jgi:hypothetical protein
VSAIHPFLSLALLAMCFSTWCCAAEPVRRGGEAVLTIEGRVLSERELLGKTRKEIRVIFDDSLEDAANVDWVRFLKLRSVPQEKIQEARGTEGALHDLYFASWFDGRLRAALYERVGASLLDNILREHGAEAEDYFDLDRIRELIKRQRACDEFLYQKKWGETPARVVYDEACRRFELQTPFEEWHRSWLSRRDRLLSGWSRQDWMPEALEWKVKSLVAHHLLAEPCAPKGRFYKEADDRVTWQRMPHDVLFFDLRPGTEKELHALLNVYVDPKGLLLPTGQALVDDWFRTVGLGVRVSRRRALGFELPELGVFRRGELIPCGDGRMAIAVP